jgi:hypothetical protein
MTATQVGDKKLTVTLKNAVIELYFVGIVIAIERKLEPLELKSMSLFSIALGFLNLANHPIVHGFSPFYDDKMQKGTRMGACLLAVEHYFLGI